MGKSAGTGVSLLLLGYSLVAAAASSDELWEFSSDGNMGGAGPPTQALRQCIVKDGVYDPQKVQNGSCQSSDYQRAGNKASWRIRCTIPITMTGKGEMTRSGDAMSGTMVIDIGGGMQSMQLMRGKRIGTCDAVAQDQRGEAGNPTR